MLEHFWEHARLTHLANPQFDPTACARACWDHYVAKGLYSIQKEMQATWYERLLRWFTR